MKTNRKGFTLIELLIVIAIIGILAAALLPTILNAPARGRDAARIGNLNSVVAAIEAYNADHGSYPLAAGSGACVGAQATAGEDDVFGADVGNYFAGGIPPSDPSGNRTPTFDPGGCSATGNYYYKHVGATGVAEYILATSMELPQNNNADSAVDPATIASGTPADLDCPATGCDYYLLIK